MAQARASAATDEASLSHVEGVPAREATTVPTLESEHDVMPTLQGDVQALAGDDVNALEDDIEVRMGDDVQALEGDANALGDVKALVGGVKALEGEASADAAPFPASLSWCVGVLATQRWQWLQRLPFLQRPWAKNLHGAAQLCGWPREPTRRPS